MRAEMQLMCFVGALCNTNEGIPVGDTCGVRYHSCSALDGIASSKTCSRLNSEIVSNAAMHTSVSQCGQYKSLVIRRSPRPLQDDLALSPIES